MQIVINVDNELYEYFSKRRSMHDDGYFSNVGKLIKALRDGTILPKGHGRLIDENKIAVIIETEDGDDFITDAPTIIEAETESEVSDADSN